jgi:hypothetical protein
VIAPPHYGRRTSVLRARHVTTAGRIGPEVEVSRGTDLADLDLRLDDGGAATFVWTHDTKKGPLLETTTTTARR